MTHRNFEIMGRQTSLRGVSAGLPATRDAMMTRDSNPFPSQSILHSENIPDPPLDVGRRLCLSLIANSAVVLLITAGYVVSVLVFGVR